MVQPAFRDGEGYRNGIALGNVEIVAIHVQYRDDGAKGHAFVAVHKGVVIGNAMRNDCRNFENRRIIAIVDQALRTPKGSFEPTQVPHAGIATEPIDIFVMSVKERFDGRQ